MERAARLSRLSASRSRGALHFLNHGIFVIMPRAALQDHTSNPTRLRSSDGRIWKYSLNVLEKCAESEKPQYSAISVMGRSVCSTSHFARDSCRLRRYRSEEHTSELPSLMRFTYAVLCTTKKIIKS